MDRNRGRRSFTVAAKSSGQQGFVSIPAKAPRMPQTVRKPLVLAAVAPPAPAVEPPNDAMPRRILPSLIAWEAPEPVAVPDTLPEPPLPRVRRVAPQGALETAPRRRGRPRKTPLPIEPATALVAEPEPEPAVVATPAVEPPATGARDRLVTRKARPDAAGLRLGERWKRRLPRSCW